MYLQDENLIPCPYKNQISSYLQLASQSEPFLIVSDPQSDPRLVLTLMKYQFLEYYSVIPLITDAAFRAAASLAKRTPHLVEDFVICVLAEHRRGEAAIRDFMRMGGNEAWARRRNLTPESTALVGVCRMLAEEQHPLSLLSYFVLSGPLSLALINGAKDAFARPGWIERKYEFLGLQSRVIRARARRLSRLVNACSRDAPDFTEAIEYGLSCLAAVYPLPIWKGALANAHAELRGEEIR